MKKILGFILLSSLLFSCNNQPNPKVWTEKYEQGLYNYLDSVTKPSMRKDQQRFKYIQFIISRLKQKVPNGLNSVSKDSLHNLNIIIGREYALQEYGAGNTNITSYYTPWTPLIEKTFRDDYIAIFQNKYPTTTNKFCDCILKKLRIIYPDSVLVPIPKDINLKVSMECKSVLETP